jgi:hypothetical protein
MRDNGANTNIQTQRLAIGLHALGGAVAGATLSTTFFYSTPSVSPPVFYTLFGLGGVIYGALAGVGIRLLLPAFSWNNVLRHATLVSAGFMGGCIICFAIPNILIVTVFVLPPLMALLLGYFARRWIADVGDFPRGAGKLGWTLGALVYTPVFYLLTFALMSPLAVRNLADGEITPVFTIGGALAGALGGWISGWITTANIQAGLKSRTDVQ